MRERVSGIDASICVGCGECVSVCPSGVLAVANGLARVVAEHCIGCGHCQAVCPAGAVSLAGADPWAGMYAVIKPTGAVIAPGAFPAGQLVDLLRSRRSCRRFTDRGVPGPALEDLVRAAVTAPSGTNSQAWTFTVLTSRAAVLDLGQAVAGFFTRLNKLAAKTLLRRVFSLIGRPELENYYREHYASVAAALVEWERDHTDRLFHGATAAVIIGSRPGASCPAEDALLAAGNLLLAAHCLGLGSCLIGYAVEAMRHDRRVKEAAGVPRTESVYAVVALGWPDVTYVRSTGRGRPVVRYKTA
ncbi:nitroreductase family protein [Desulfovibrio sp. TomC]|uniref:nitroreductase family protein n=1 Tax=Desulfovibrio sp. TomC TaxID=1562888 RepID=UPI0005757092|nr:nitroreductase family protein [Desulfovibrio sp. TomC]KHK04116.1 Ferredoxin [Desulfovibrio sp. TomC]